MVRIKNKAMMTQSIVANCISMYFDGRKVNFYYLIDKNYFLFTHFFEKRSLLKTFI